MPNEKDFMIFAGCPATNTMFAIMVKDTSNCSPHIEEEVDCCLDIVDGSRKMQCVWTVFDLEICDVATACERFGKMMASHSTAFKSENVQTKA